ncbi:glycerate kinase [Staphylococcus xylosus]|uniref:Glycerate kinase n=1 Tax=Staphylococcus xylosus TaxID=1288 RepID=A0A939NIN5_STAXY|nr:glycerate kinase [Staphylococcus xylosus]
MHLENYLEDADLVITGEGKIDFQTFMVKRQ